MYNLSSWRRHLCNVVVNLLHQDPARTVGDPITAQVSGEVTQVSRMSTVYPKFQKKSPRYRGSPFCTKNPLELRGSHLKLKFLEKSPRYQGGPMYTLSSWRSHLGIMVFDLLHPKPTRTVRGPFKV